MRNEIDNVFVLCTGRCGSTTFIRACQHIENFSAQHESRSHLLGRARVAYPTRHIEADNRLTWFLPRLERAWDVNRVLFVHLKRDKHAVAMSFAKRKNRGLIKAYREGILLGYDQKTDEPDYLAVAYDYIDCVEEAIQDFLTKQPHVMRVDLETLKDDFLLFCRQIGATVDMEMALHELETKHNASATPSSLGARVRLRLKRAVRHFRILTM